jgi:hypothetical protein
VEEIIQYCRQDVKVLRDIVEFGRQNGYVQYADQQNSAMQIAVDW